MNNLKELASKLVAESLNLGEISVEMHESDSNTLMKVFAEKLVRDNLKDIQQQAAATVTE